MKAYREGMNQIQMLELVNSMNPGQAVVVTGDDMRRCAAGNLRSRLDGPARESDVKQFIEQITANWDVRIVPHGEQDQYTMHKNGHPPAVDHRTWV